MNIPKSWSCFYSNIIHYPGCTAAYGLKRVLREMFSSVQDKKLPLGKGLYERSKRDFFNSSVAPLFLIDIFESLFLTDKHK